MGCTENSIKSYQVASSKAVLAMNTDKVSIELREMSGRDSPTSMLYSLRTASSATLRPDSIVSRPELLIEPEVLHAIAEELEAALQSELTAAQARPSDAGEISASEGNHYLLLSLSRTAKYGSIVHGLALRLIILQLSTNRADGLARALVSLPLEDIGAFFDGLSDSEIAEWLRSRSFWEVLVKTMSDRESTLDSPRALALLILYNCDAFALLFRSDVPRSGVSPPCDIDLLLTYIQATYTDCLPQLLDGDLESQVSDQTIHAVAIYLDRCSAARFSTFLEHLLGHIAPPSYHAVRSRDLKLLLDAAPYLQESCSAEAVLSRRSYMESHPASPFLYCAIRLASRSGHVRRGLVELGVLKAVEHLYDEDKVVIETDRGDMVVSATSRHMMIQLCYLLLRGISDCYDLSKTTLVEELRADITTYSRSVNRRFFAPEVWEIRDD